ncbi:MAG: hypothetical protein EZS28_009246 [Streblomastix strix]|uniref:Uncharacterized protein n=1 Tax=Streblomastix strix TaxID=222440 RepID=A0A5J4WLH0_9EUKA|nr:MAG: hypothetical protein EZS28_009246 [Streblomastix strix]
MVILLSQRKVELDVTPLADSETAVAGTSNEFSRRDHKHPLQVSDVYQVKILLLTVDTIPISDSADGSYETVDSYARSDHSHLINIQTNASIVPIVNGVGNNGTTAYYSRHDHFHPQQLNYDGNVTATKFIRSERTDNDFLLSDETTKKVVLANISAFQGEITDILTTYAQPTLPTGYSGIYQLFPNRYGSTQTNPTATSYDDGLRIARSATQTGNLQIQLGCSRTSNTGLIEGQWSIFTPSNTAISNPYGLVLTVASQAGDNTRGLQISVDGNTLTFNGNGFVDVAADQTITGIKTFGKLLQVIPSNDGTFNEGIRIRTIGNNAQNPLGFTLVKAGQEGQADRGLQISADGSILTLNGQVIAGAGAAIGSVIYSYGNPILQGANNLGTEGGFYSNGTNIFQRSHALQFDPYYQEQ